MSNEIKTLNVIIHQIIADVTENCEHDNCDHYIPEMTTLIRHLERTREMGVAIDLVTQKPVMTYINGILNTYYAGKLTHHIHPKIMEIGFSPILDDLFELEEEISDVIFWSPIPDEVIRQVISITNSIGNSVEITDIIDGFERLLQTNETNVRGWAFKTNAETKLSIDFSYDGCNSFRVPVGKQLIIDIKNGKFRKDVLNAFNNDNTKTEKESAMKNETILGAAKNTVQNLRLKKLLAEIKQTETPQEAYTLLTNFLGKFTEIEGSISREDTKVSYHFSYIPARNEVNLGLDIGLRNPQTGEIETSLMKMTCTVNDKTIGMVYNNILDLGKLFK